MTISGTEKWLDFDIEPNGNRLYIYLDEIPKRASGIILSDDQATPSRLAEVVKCGPLVKGYAKGDRILIGCHSGQNLYLWQFGMLNERWKIITESEILAKVVKEPAA